MSPATEVMAPTRDVVNVYGSVVVREETNAWRSRTQCLAYYMADIISTTSRRLVGGILRSDDLVEAWAVVSFVSI